MLIFIFLFLFSAIYCQATAVFDNSLVFYNDYVLLDAGNVSYPLQDKLICSEGMIPFDTFEFPQYELNSSKISPERQKRLNDIYQYLRNESTNRIHELIEQECRKSQIAEFTNIREKHSLSHDLYRPDARLTQWEENSALLAEISWKDKLNELENDRKNLLRLIFTPEISFQLAENHLKNMIDETMPKEFDYLAGLTFANHHCSETLDISGQLCLTFGKNQQTQKSFKFHPYSVFSEDFGTLKTYNIDQSLLFLEDGTSVDTSKCGYLTSYRHFNCPLRALKIDSCSPFSVESCPYSEEIVTAPFTRIKHLNHDLIEVATTEKTYNICRESKCETHAIPKTGIMMVRLP